MVTLMYHDIVTKEDKSSGFQNRNAMVYKVLSEKFERQVQTMAGKDVLFTLDDGGISLFTIAAPILEKYNLKGIFFIPTDFIGTSGFLTADQIRELDARGHIIGSHSCSHSRNMSRMSHEQIMREWGESKSLLEKIVNHEVSIASIPYGGLNKGIVKCAAECGVKSLYTSIPTVRIKTKYGMRLYGRYVVHRSMSVDEIIQITNRKTKRLKVFLRWLAIETLKSVLGDKYIVLKNKLT